MGPISLSQTSKPSSITLGDSHVSSFPSLFKKKKRMKGEEKDFTIPKSVFLQLLWEKGKNKHSCNYTSYDPEE